MPDISSSTPVGRHVEELTNEECLRLLRSRYLGRVAFVTQGRPTVRPVNYVMDDGDVVFRIGVGSTFDALLGEPVAFEIDAADLDYHTGWSVLIQGTAREAWEPEELDRLERLPLRPWAPGARDQYIRIATESLTGRRIT